MYSSPLFSFIFVKLRFYPTIDFAEVVFCERKWSLNLVGTVCALGLMMGKLILQMPTQDADLVACADTSDKGCAVVQ